ncbi:MAG: type II toxin-antitoxin system VapC family toxin [Chloroflexi bacterium]|nr:type II toxin-antitoxin system VapC family toxin [Chloroflexota bacterium]
MALAYLDTSALVKRYLPEVGSAWVARLCQQETVVISLVAVPELASALARHAREGVLSAQQGDMLFRAFLRDVGTFTVVEPNQEIAQQAAVLLLTAPPNVRLRALDTLHLASARLALGRARRHGATTGSFVTADRALLVAAKWAGLPTLNPEDYP